jgi:hypothetical protein
MMRGTQQQQVGEGVTFFGRHVGPVAGRAGPDPVDVRDLGVLLIDAGPYFENNRHDAAGGVAAAVAHRPEGGKHGRGEALALACTIGVRPGGRSHPHIMTAGYDRKSRRGAGAQGWDRNGGARR